MANYPKRNSEGYYDPTAYEGVKSIVREENALWWTASVRESWSACLTVLREKRGNERCGATQGGDTFPGDGGGDPEDRST